MEKKITLGEAMMLYLLIGVSPTIVTSAGFAVRTAERAAWITPLVAVLPGMVLVWVTAWLFHAYPTSSFDEMLYDICGAAVGKIILVLYGIWFLLLAATYLRFYAERIQTSLLAKTGIDFLLIMMLALVWFALHKGLATVGNFARVTLPIIVILLIVLGVFALPKMRIEHLYPVTYRDAVPILKGGAASISVTGYLSCLLFLGNQIRDKSQIKRQGTRSVLLLAGISMAVIAVSVGTCGVSVTKRTPIPFFLAVKQIQILGILERFEPVLIGVWMISDFLIIYFSVYCFLQIVQSVCTLQDNRNLRWPVLLGLFAGAKIIAVSGFELERFVQYLLAPVGAVFKYALPIGLTTVGIVKRKRRAIRDAKQ